MSLNLPTLHEGAIFLSDAHYSFKHPELLDFLKALRAQEIQSPQLVLMGDIFDLLFGDIPKTVSRNQDVVDLINTLSDNIEILYLEGNHDFNLAEIFPSVNCYKISEQPLVLEHDGQRVALAHGDFDAPLGYRVYTAVIRNAFVLRTLSFLNRIGREFILKGLDAKLSRKNDCHEMYTFEKYINHHLRKKEMDQYDMFIEGHHHQDKQFDVDGCRYINLPAFACGLKYKRLEQGTLQTETFKGQGDV